MGLRKKSGKSRRDRDVGTRTTGTTKDALVLSIVKSDITFGLLASSNQVDFRPCWIGKCIHCNSWLQVNVDGSTTSATIEHIVPTSAGGSGTDLLNLALACKRCNNEKGIRHDPEYPRDPRAVEVIEALLQRRKQRWRNPV